MLPAFPEVPMIAVLCFAVALSTTPPAPTLDAATRAKIDAAVRAQLASKEVPSASVAVIVDGQVAYLQAYGEAQLSPKRPAASVMRYAIGSISKEFLATAMLMLEADGRLGLDDKLGKYLPVSARPARRRCGSCSRTPRASATIGRRTM